MPDGTVFWWETVGVQPGLRPTSPAHRHWRRRPGVTLELGFASADEVTAAHDKLVAAGAPSYQTPISWNGGDIRFAMVVDPDGHRTGLRWPLAG